MKQLTILVWLVLSAIIFLCAQEKASAFYSPDTGRWLNRDPIQEAGGINLYQSFGNSPNNVGDIDGLVWAIFSPSAYANLFTPTPTWIDPNGHIHHNTPPSDRTHLPPDTMGGMELPPSVDFNGKEPDELIGDMGKGILTDVAMLPLGLEREGGELLNGAVKCERLAKDAKGVSVIGPRDAYEEFAKKIGARYLPKAGWTQAKNEKYVNDIIARGDDVVFAG